MRGNAGPVARMSGAAVRGPTGFEVWGYHVAMVRYRRNRVDGGTYFFTVTLADRRSTAMVDHVNSLRTAFRVARQERPFALDPVVILPDHLHAILTLPEGDANFAGRQISPRLRCAHPGYEATTGSRPMRRTSWRSRKQAHAVAMPVRRLQDN
jgi:REP element-mobilizing transposase RayT